MDLRRDVRSRTESTSDESIPVGIVDGRECPEFGTAMFVGRRASNEEPPSLHAGSPRLPEELFFESFPCGLELFRFEDAPEAEEVLFPFEATGSPAALETAEPLKRL